MSMWALKNIFEWASDRDHRGDSTVDLVSMTEGRWKCLMRMHVLRNRRDGKNCPKIFLGLALGFLDFWHTKNQKPYHDTKFDTDNKSRLIVIWSRLTFDPKRPNWPYLVDRLTVNFLIWVIYHIWDMGYQVGWQWGCYLLGYPQYHGNCKQILWHLTI